MFFNPFDEDGFNFATRSDFTGCFETVDIFNWLFLSAIERRGNW